MIKNDKINSFSLSTLIIALSGAPFWGILTSYMIHNSSKASLVQQLFNEVNEELDYRRASYNPEQSVEIMQKTLYNYYDKRKNLIDLYDLIDSSDSIYLKRKVSDYQYQVDEAIKDINRAFVGNQIYLTEKSNLEQEKHYLLEIYAQLNYNSWKGECIL